MKTIPAFRRWLLAEIEYLDGLHETEINHCADAAETIREAGEIALRLGLASVYQKCRVPSELLGQRAAKTILGKCLAECPKEERTRKPAAGTEDAKSPLTVSAVAHELGVSARTVRDLIDCGKLPSFRVGKGRGMHRISPADYEAFKLSSGRVKLQTTDAKRHRLLRL